MACNQTINGLVRDCAPSIGGIAEALIALHEDIQGVTVTEDKISAISMETGKKFHRYAFAPGTGSFTSNLQVDAANGVNYVQTDIVLQFNRMDTTKRVEVAALSVNETAVIIKDRNGKYWFFGKDEPVTASAGDGQTGTARSDANKYDITLQDNAQTYPFEVDPAAIETIVD